jgi:serine/threonine protein kinase
VKVIQQYYAGISHEELCNLFQVNDLENDHLIKLLGAFDYGGMNCFMFPWASGGNLRTYWKHYRNPHSPPRDRSILYWILRQVSGLTTCLKLLHEANCRHGDLKPENILFFPDTGDGGTLVITDFGLSKFHSVATQHRSVSSCTRASSTRYAPPDAVYEEQGTPMSRAYDNWSMGCILLELLVWLLYGYDKLHGSLVKKVDKFWAPGPEDWIINSCIQGWIDQLTRDLVADTALREILRVVKTQLLIAKLPGEGEDQIRGRASASELSEQVEKIYQRALCDPSYMFDLSMRNSNSLDLLDVPGRHGDTQSSRISPSPHTADIEIAQRQETSSTLAIDVVNILEPGQSTPGILLQAPCLSNPGIIELGNSTFHETGTSPPRDEVSPLLPLCNSNCQLT